MNIRYAGHFKAALRKIPREIRRKFYKQAAYLVRDISHPSLRAKKYDETKDIWQARVDRHYRFYFVIEGDTYILTNITKHAD